MRGTSCKSGGDMRLPAPMVAPPLGRPIVAYSAATLTYVSDCEQIHEQ